ncbi:energy-coupling factor transporter transmembrane component T [Virgibacillus sp. C22-A2]|uniref:Energy-coupling factor transporter transmembrane component T n=1 Tax=Virgibacillus tibetensis TaxID=3042313 RepID=A0ABU6KCM5_9BACI|nr:energy-coupling factor transporter transmembrane component T [Virgibacillus sp. C22-A2]
MRGIRSFHPFIVLLYYILAIAGFMLYQHPLFLATGVSLIIVYNFLLDRGTQLKKWAWMITVMSIFILVLTPLFNRRGNHILFYLFNNQVMLEALIQGVMIALTLAGILTMFITFNIVMTADKFLYLFSSVSKQWALLTMLSMRFVPLLRRKLTDMENIQEVKGLSVRKGSIRNRVKNGMLLLQMILTGALENSIQAADSMTARGYGLRRRSNYQAFYMKRQDWIAGCCLVSIASLVIYGWWLGDGVLMLLPVLESMGLIEREWFYFIIWIMLIGFPVWAEGKEVVKWKYYQRKM